MKRILLIFGLLAAVPVMAQVQPVAQPGYQYFDNNGAPLAGGKICTYSAGSTSPLATFADSIGSVQNADPVILDSAGRATIWYGPQSYKIVVRTAGSDTTCSTGTIIRTDDNIPGAGQAVTSNAFSAITAATNSNAGTFAMSGNTLDLSAATFKSPTGAGAAPTTSGLISYDTTANKFVFGVNGATKSFGLASSAACSAGQFVSSPATATAIAGCSAPTLTGSTCTNCTINGTSTFTGAITGATIGSTSITALTGPGSSAWYSDGNIAAVGYQSHAGQSGAFGSDFFNFNYLGSNEMGMWANNTNLGTVVRADSATPHDVVLRWSGTNLEIVIDGVSKGLICTTITGC